MMEYNEKQLFIMEKALALFVDIGYHKSSVRAVAKAADVNVAMIFYYFGSKEKLLEAIFSWHLKRLEQKWLDIEKRQNEKQPLENLELYIDGFWDLATEAKNFFRLMLRQSTLLSQDGFHISKITILKRVMENIIKKNVDEGVAMGIFNKNVDPEFLMQFTSGTFFHTLIKYDLNEKNNQHHNVLEANDAEIEKLKENLKFIYKAYLEYGIH